MRTEDLKKLATGSVLFNLNRIITPKIVTILYFLGLATILLWAINHFFYSFRFGFGNGLWGLLEIAVFGLFAFVVLRIICDSVIVFFKAHSAEAAEATRTGATTSLIDEVRDAIEDLADEEPDEPFEPSPAAPPSTRPAAASAAPAARASVLSPATKPGTAAQGLPNQSPSEKAALGPGKATNSE